MHALQRGDERHEERRDHPEHNQSIRAENQEQAREGAMRMVQEAYPYPGSVYTVAVAPIALEMFAE